MSLHTSHICFAILIWSHPHGLFTVCYCCRFSFLLIHSSSSSQPSHVSDCHWTSGESVDGEVLTDEKGMMCLCFLSCCSFFSLCCACSNTVLLYYTVLYLHRTNNFAILFDHTLDCMQCILFFMLHFYRPTLLSDNVLLTMETVIITEQEVSPSICVNRSIQGDACLFFLSLFLFDRTPLSVLQYSNTVILLYCCGCCITLCNECWVVFLSPETVRCFSQSLACLSRHLSNKVSIIQ